jgi:dienelactone hydrolase
LVVLLVLANGLLGIRVSSGQDVFSQVDSRIGNWDLNELNRVPVMKWVSQDGPVHSLLYAGQEYEGRQTEVFAFYASPLTLGDATDVNQTFPGIVLIHGGGGTAFAEWTWLWAKRGYAAIAMDLSGSRPIAPIYDASGVPIANQASKPSSRTKLPNGGPDQGHPEKFGSIGGDHSDDWPYHAVANVVSAHSLLRSFPEVDPERTAVTGISWGGYTTCMVASVDSRFKAAVPVYGCGFLFEGESVQKPSIDNLGDRRELWITSYDPSSHLSRCRVPMLFVNGTNDVHYPLDSYQKSFDLVPGPKQMRIEVKMGHSHPAGWAPAEIATFIDSHCRNGKPLPRVTSIQVDGDQIVATYESELPIHSAMLHYTSDAGLRSTRTWTSVPASVGPGMIRVEKSPGDANTWFLSITDERGAMVSSDIRFQP